jgi:hypothetical protein
MKRSVIVQNFRRIVVRIRTLAKVRDQKFLRVKGNTVVVTRPRELQKLLQRNLGEL